jgi:CHRD domain
VKKVVRLTLACALVSFLVAAAAAASVRDTYKVSASLTAGKEVPKPKGATGATGSFSGMYVENAKGAVLTWTLSFKHLTGSATAAHIHTGKPGVAGAVIVPLCAPCKSGQTGKTTIPASVIATIESGNAYVNVHTVKNAGGEIRGQVKATG